MLLVPTLLQSKGFKALATTQPYQEISFTPLNHHAYTCIHHRIQLAVGDMTMSG